MELGHNMEFKALQNPAFRLIGISRFDRVVFGKRDAWANPRNNVVVDDEGRVLKGKELFPKNQVFFHGGHPVMIGEEVVERPSKDCSILFIANHPDISGPCITLLPLAQLAQFTFRRLRIYQALDGDKPLCVEDNRTLFEVPLKVLPEGVYSTLIPALSKRPGKPPFETQPSFTVKIGEGFKMGEERHPERFRVGQVAARFGTVPTNKGWSYKFGQLVLYPAT